MERVARRIEQNTRRVAELGQILQTLPKAASGYDSLTGEINSLEKENANLESNKEGWADYFYYTYAGEIEARNIQKRLDENVRAKGSPNVTLDKARSQDITVQYLRTSKGNIYGALLPDDTMSLSKT